MEVDHIAKSLFVSEASGSGFYCFDATIHTLGMTVVHAKDDRVENAAKCLRKVFDVI